MFLRYFYKDMGLMWTRSNNDKKMMLLVIVFDSYLIDDRDIKTRPK